MVKTNETLEAMRDGAIFRLCNQDIKKFYFFFRSVLTRFKTNNLFDRNNMYHGLVPNHCLKISAIEYMMPVPDRLELITFTFINNEKETDKLLNQNHSFLLFPPLVLHCLVLLRITCAMRHKHLVLEDVLINLFYLSGNQYLMDMMFLISLNSSKTYTCSNFAMHILYRIIIKIVSTYSFNEPERKKSEFIFCICSNFYPFTAFRINNWRPNCNNLRLYNHFKALS
ncbi:unnamed protein product [Rhizophagus irregularis]|nr:unnamed protein product [Rhizophagus irregularis]